MIQSTSKKAYYEDALPSIGKRQQIVLECIIALGEATNTEIATKLGWPINTITPRVNELRKFGIVGQSCKRHCKITGRLAIVWTVERNQKLI